MKFINRHGPNVIHADESDKPEAESAAGYGRISPP